jgi:uncharacterized protein YbbK (DUF523 family)
MNITLSEKIKIGISACMYGCNVRYNKKGWDMIQYFGREAGDFIWYPVCPECMAGLGVPRDPIRVAGESGEEVWNGNAKIKNRQGIDVTSQILRGSSVCLEMLKASDVNVFIFMEGSPTCGVYRTTLKNKRLGKPPGVFGAKLLSEGYFLIPAADLQSPIKRWDWRRRLHAFVWLKKVDIENKEQLFDVWHRLKFLCQEIDRKNANEIGKKLASLPKGFDQQQSEMIRKEISEILRRPSSIKSIKHMLWKNYIYYLRKTNDKLENIHPPESLRSMTIVANELMDLERKALEKDVLFGSTPVIYRKNR